MAELKIISIDSLGNMIPAIETATLENVKMDLPTKETYVRGLYVPYYDFREWSDPVYQCTECGGGMCKNLKMECCSLPPMYIYRCDKCGHTDYLPA